MSIQLTAATAISSLGVPLLCSKSLFQTWYGNVPLTSWHPTSPCLAVVVCHHVIQHTLSCMLSLSVSMAVGGASAYPFTELKLHNSSPSLISKPRYSAPSALAEPSASVGMVIIISGTLSESKLAIIGPGNRI